MNENKLISVAMLETDLRVKRVEEPIEYFEKWILYALYFKNREVASTTQLQEDIKEIFGIDIHPAVIKRLLRKLAKKGYLSPNSKGILKVQKNKMKEQNFKSIEKARRDFERMLNKLVSYFVEYVEKRFQDPDFSEENAKNLLSQYLEAKGISILKHILEGKALPRPPANRKYSYYTASFLKHVLEKEPELTTYLEKFIKGSLLYAYLYYSAPTSQKFTKLDIYLDTPVVLGLLGYKGESIQKYTKELIRLLKEEGATLKVFVATINEVERVLMACKSALVVSDIPSIGLKYDVLQEFIKRKATPAHVQREIENLRIKLEQIGIKIEKFPPHELSLSIDESKFEEILDNAVHYQNREALIHDVSCVSAIYRLRRGISSVTLENAQAIFLTTNSKLVQASYKWWRKVEKKKGIPPVVLGEVIAAIAWVKQPLKAPNLPKLAVIADCYEMLNPPDTLWSKYIQAVEELRSKGELREIDVHLLRYSAEVPNFLMDKTYGDPELITEGTVVEILEKLRNNILRDKEIEIEKMKKRMKELEHKSNKYADDLREERKRLFENYYKTIKYSLMIGAILLSLAFNILRYLFISSDKIKGSITALSILFLIWTTIWEFIPVKKMKIISGLARKFAVKLSGINPDKLEEVRQNP